MIKQYRLANNLSQEKLAEKIGIVGINYKDLSVMKKILEFLTSKNCKNFRSSR